MGIEATITPEPTLYTTLLTSLIHRGPAVGLLLVGTLCALALMLASRLASLLRQLKLKRRWANARVAESRAVEILSSQGYEILGTQVEGTYDLQLDGTAQSVALRADLLVARRGKRYIAEVKSGKVAPKISFAATRRQLLEYRFAFDISGVLLVDASTELVHRIEFPFRRDEPRASSLTFAVGFWLLLVVVAAVLAWLLQVPGASIDRIGCEAQAHQQCDDGVGGMQGAGHGFGSLPTPTPQKE